MKAAAAVMMITMTMSGTGPAAGQSYETWTAYLGGADSAQYSSLAQINRSNVATMKVAWTYPTGPGNYRFNPIVIGRVMYVVAANNSIVALDATNGNALWVHPNTGQIGNRGINYWENGDRTDRRLLYLNAGFLTAIDAETGATISSFGNGGRVDLRAGLHRDTTGVRPLQTNNPGRIFEDLIIIALPASAAGYASTPGDIQAYDVVTGKLKWVFHTVPERGEFGDDTWPADMIATGGGVHSWSELTVDAGRGILYVPLGSPRFDYYGGNRRGANLFGNSLVALDARTGKRLWHYQLVHHDLWDYDLPTAPKLLTLQHEGRTIDAVIQATKWGYLYTFDRVSGEPIWPIREVPVPESDVPGEQAWPTQPLPVAPPPFSRQAFGRDDIDTYLSEEEQARYRERLRNARDEGLFTPPSLQGSLRLAGGSSWGGAAVDPTNGRLYVTSMELPTVVTVRPPSARGRGGAARGGRGETAPEPSADPGVTLYDAMQEFLWAGNGLSAIAPPWSYLTAYDMNAGTILWRVPNGSVAGIDGPTGSQSPRGGPLVTAGGLIFLATSSDRKLRAYDQENGRVLWQLDLGTAAEGVPATYQVDGRQYLVVTAGAGQGTFQPSLTAQPSPVPGRYMVFTLSE